MAKGQTPFSAPGLGSTAASVSLRRANGRRGDGPPGRQRARCSPGPFPCGGAPGAKQEHQPRFGILKLAAALRQLAGGVLAPAAAVHGVNAGLRQRPALDAAEDMPSLP